MAGMKNRRILAWLLAAICLMSACFALESGIIAEAAEDGQARFETTITKDADGRICVNFEDLTVVLPAYWSGKCELKVNGEESASFYQKKSRDLWTEELGYPNGGHLFTICFSRYLDYLDLPSYRTLGTTAEGYYYVTLPTDFQAYTEDEEALSEYQQMSQDEEWVLDQITMNHTGIPTDSGYILPLSATTYLMEEDLVGLGADQLQMAINEIYARRHRKFILPEVREYFEAQEWYDGYIEAEEFSTDDMNAYECANINLIVAYMEGLS